MNIKGDELEGYELKLVVHHEARQNINNDPNQSVNAKHNKI